MNRPVRQFLAVSATALAVALLVRVGNHHLAPLQISVGVGGMLITLAALRLPVRVAMCAAFAVGLGIDAASPVAFGQNALLLLTACSLVVGIRHRIPREELAVAIAVAVVINLLLVTTRTLLYADHWPAPSAGWLRVFADLIASQLLVVVIAPWFFAFQRHTLSWLGAELSEPQINRFA